MEVACTQCKARLSLSGSATESSSSAPLPGRLEESFLLLDEAFRAAQAGQEPSLAGERALGAPMGV